MGAAKPRCNGDVAGIDQAKLELKPVDFWKTLTFYSQRAAVILVGPMGTGKRYWSLY